MNYIAIDTSGKNLSLVAKNNGKIFTYYDENCGVKHSDKIMVELENLLNVANLTLKECDFIACVVGAGSFTGIRIGVATAKALCFAENISCLSVTSFDTLSYNKQGGKILAVIDAGHNGFYVCAYNDYQVKLQPCYITREQLNELAKEYAVVCSSDIEGLNVEKVSVLEGLINAVEKNADKISNNLDSLVPLYVRKSQAEEGR